MFRVFNYQYKFILLSFVFLILGFFYTNFPKLNVNFDEKIREILFEIRGPIADTRQVTIVNIDENSISKFGQWPFSRLYMAQVIANLTNAGAGVIGLDIVFSENDRSSPSFMAQQLNVQGDFLNTDELLGNVIGNSPTIIGYYFNNDTHQTMTPKTAANFDKNSSKHLIKFTGATLNIPPITNNAYSSGFFNAFNEYNGKITKLPLMLQYNNQIYPSLPLEMIRAAYGAQVIKIFEDDYALNGIGLNDLTIPTDTQSFFKINFRGPAKTFQYLSFADIYNGNFDTQDIQGKFILIGTDVTTLADLRSTVYDLAMPGVEIHANLIDNILKGDFLYKPSFAQLFDLGLILLLTLGLGFILFKLNAIQIILFITTLFIVIYGSFYYILFEFGLILNLLYPFISIIITTLLAYYLNYTKEQKQKEFIKDKFAKKVSIEVANDLIQNPSDTFKAKEKEVTVFFSDIRNFTNISEQLNSAQNLISMLNLYLEPMTNIINKNNGTVDKFIGDAIMAYWNAPKAYENHADLAVNSAIEQINTLDRLSLEIKQKYGFNLEIGIGIHTGLVVVGEMGSAGRSDYSVIGDNVNLASRVESLTKFFGAKILITQDTLDKLEGEVHYRYVAKVIVKGKTKPITLYEIFAKKDYEQYKTHKNIYEDAITLYLDNNLEKSKELFHQLYLETKHTLYKTYLGKIETLQEPNSDRLEFVMSNK